MARLSPMVLVPPVLFAGLAALFFVGMQREDPDALPSALQGREAPAVAGTPLGDLPRFEDADLRDGQVKLVNFWASWCAPCRAEHPVLEKMTGDGVTILGVNYKDKPDAALGFLTELGNPYAAVIADDKGRMGIDWGIYGVPETFVIDGQGRIVLRFAGPITQRSLESDILPAIAQARGEATQ
ncbi:cytochrome c biogenesis protein CcmG/thiol:disulfide interchange protein DsbE [Albidovulum inexpectatum]|uniref:Cytochrome c biogenesis protein CcmG/thiol:disulfide interchange protein DsbE n=1 Tax=Albidovulum inexpectatum TaxID=196587 RepID=A0A2S5JET8_9RHOB|nr:DsbE family thiol:disulfide interchange protein [Albidovulum inexpectatum]PPB79994.1 cytochrome c biogenesis protein CcmG/thiol:disulfide interchange protein DsbE [Albidovulum inexpectatum]